MEYRSHRWVLVVPSSIYLLPSLLFTESFQLFSALLSFPVCCTLMLWMWLLSVTALRQFVMLPGPLYLANNRLAQLSQSVLALQNFFAQPTQLTCKPVSWPQHNKLSPWAEPMSSLTTTPLAQSLPWSVALSAATFFLFVPFSPPFYLHTSTTLENN